MIANGFKIVSRFFYRSHRTYTSYHTPENSAVRASRSSDLSNSRRRVHRGAKRPQRSVDASRPSFHLKNEKKHKKAEKSFEFSPFACKLFFGIAFLTVRNPVSSSFQPYFNQKYTKTDQVCKQSFDPEYEIPAGALCLRFCWAFLCRLWIGFLVGPSCTRMGKRPAFLCSSVKN